MKFGSNYIPERGDIVLLNFSPQAGKEQKGKRPAFVLSPRIYNEKVGLALMCPITSKIKNYPFEILLPKDLNTVGVVLSDHVKNLDYRIRKIEFLEKTSDMTIKEVQKKLRLLLE